MDKFVIKLIACFVALNNYQISANWFHKNNKHYYFANVQAKWSDAQQDCQRQGANLVTISSKSENNFLFRKNPSDDPRSGMSSHWIGLKGFCAYGDCTWEWSNGEAVDVTEFHWALGYPILEDFVTYAYLDHVSKAWKNSRDEYRSYICEAADGCEPENPCEPPLICDSDHMGGYRCLENNSSDKSTRDPCHNNPCNHGMCIAQGDAYTCNCHPGYTGSNCTEDIDECLVSTDFTYKTNKKDTRGLCINGKCRNTVGSFDCDCTRGFVGQLCSADLDECIAYGNEICNNGNCTNTVGNFLCTCFDGYRGDYCDIVDNNEQRNIPVISPTSTPSEGGSNVLPIIIGAVVGVIVLLAIVIIVVVLKRKNIICASRDKPKSAEDGKAGSYAEVSQREDGVTDMTKMSE